MSHRQFCSAIAFALLALCPLAALASDIVLSAVSIHLFLESTGEFTADVTKMKGFGAHNFQPFADGMDFGGGNFHSLLVKVRFTSPSEGFKEGQIAELTVSDLDTGKIIFRHPISDIYVGTKGQTTVPFLLSGHECQGLRVSVKSGSVLIQKELHFRCAE